LRQVREDLQRREGARQADEALVLALDAVRALEIPHLEPEEEDDQVVH
jgi:hypothetical protein